MKFLKGYKTYLVAAAAVIWGLHTGNMEMVGMGLGMAGLRHAIAG